MSDNEYTEVVVEGVTITIPRAHNRVDNQVIYTENITRENGNNENVHYLWSIIKSWSLEDIYI